MKAERKITGTEPFAIIVMGVSGCGKTTLTAHLAERLAAPGFEGDSYHSAANVAKMRAGEPLNDGDRWPWLDELGGVIGDAVRAQGVAVAACSALKRVYRERLEKAAGVPLMFVLLDGEREEIAPHLAARAGHYMAPSLLDSQLATLERPGPDERALVLHCYQPVEDLGREVVAWTQGVTA